MRILHMHLLPYPLGRNLMPAVAMIGLLLAVAPGARTEEPPVFAITNARIVTVTGPPIEKGTVVFRNGIIEAVGTNINVPGDARIIDATGLTLYPGIIDALSDVGLEEARAQTPAAARSVGTPGPTPTVQQPSPPAAERQILTPYRQAAELLNPASQKIEASRAAGITTALVVPRGGIFLGQSSLVNLSGGDVGRMVVKTPIAFHISLAGGGGFGRGYPSSLMGIHAFVKQTLLDAQQYGVAWRTYNSNPGVPRPEYSRALEAMQPLVRQEIPLVLPADTPTDIQRLLDLADAYQLNFILAGGAEAGALGATLRERNIPVLLTVKFPEQDRDADPEAKEELNELRRRVEAPANAAALGKAGVKFAFQSGDTTNPRDFIRNVGKAVKAGLDKETALRALTITPAEILGVADRLGSIERNKTANLILTTGDIFDANTRVKYVFVDGRKFEIIETEPPRTAEGESAPGPSGGMNVAGAWNLNVNTPEGAVAITLNLQQQGSAVTGTVSSPMGSADIQEGSIAGGRLTFRVSAGGISASFSGTIRGSNMTGTLNAGAMGTMEFSGARSPREL